MDHIRQQITSAFATPVLMRKVPELEAINPRLKEIVLEHETIRAQNVGSNIGGWQSDHDLMQWPEPEMQVFQQHLGQALQEMTSATVDDFPPEMDIIVTGWANTARNGTYTRAHSHDGSLWSAIYYVAAEPAPESHPHSGLLSFVDPRSGSRSAPKMQPPFGYRMDIQPEEGLLVVFPGYLLHEVHPYFGEDVRISLSANALLVPDMDVGET
ncbi:MAG: hypothetical protein CMM48_07140 [Rhodospirillaceae bacterium]|nr:hypothetical protein [Rhodospirillaceae bacterium]HAA92420.1 hypothetical protein [Rhodospirillaceae bacterium]